MSEQQAVFEENMTMSEQQAVFEEIMTTGRGSCEYKCKTKNLHNLKRGKFIESVFDVAGKKWTLALMIFFYNGVLDVAKVILSSCNAERVTAYVEMSVTNTRNGKTIHFKKKGEVATRYCALIREDINISELTGSDQFGSEDELSIELQLKYIDKAEDKQSKNDPILKTVKLHIVNRDRINEWLQERNLGLAPPKKRRSEVDNISFVRSFVHRDIDKRYWQCTRSEHGDLLVRKCLNDSDLLDIFGEIREEDGPDWWVTVFEEKKKSDEEFDPINENTIIIFCKLLTPGIQGSSYLGYLLVEKNTSVGQLLSTITETFRCCLSKIGFNAYLERGGNIKNITARTRPLPDDEDDIGYVIILREKEKEDDDVSEEAVKKELMGDQMRDPRDQEPGAQRPPQGTSGASEPQGPSSPPPEQGDPAPTAAEDTNSEPEQPPLNRYAMTSNSQRGFFSVVFECAQELWSRKPHK